MKLRSLIISVFTIIVMCLNVIMPINAFPIVAASTASTVTLDLSTSSAIVGGNVTVTGTADANTWVSIKVLDNTQSVVFYDAVKSDVNGNYSDTFTVPSVNPGTLTVVAGYGSNVANASLTISSDSQPPTDEQAPAWPTGSTLSASAVTQTGLTLTWTAATDNTTVTGYKIYQGSTLLGSVNNNTFTYNVTELTPGTQYTFKVQAGDAANNWGTNGPSKTVTTSAASGGGGSTDTLQPQWPTDAAVTVSKTQTQAHLSWSTAADNVGVTGYQIIRNNSVDNTNVVVGTVNGTTTSFTDNGLQENINTYSWSVKAFDAAGNWSTAITGQPVTGQSFLNFNLSQSYLVTVSGSTATNIARISDNTSVPVNPTIMLNFDRGVTNDVVWDNNKGSITLQDSSGVSVPIDVFWLTNQPGTSYVQDIFLTPLSNLTPGKTYTITIGKNLKANNGHTLGESDGLDKTVSFTVAASSSGITDTQAPQWPAGATVTINKNQTQAILTWPSATDNVGVVSYKIERDNVELGTVDGQTTTFTDPSLQQGNNSYVWTVLAVDKAGNWSTSISGQTSDHTSEHTSLTGAYLTSINNNVSTTGVDVSGSSTVSLNPTIKLCFSHNVADDAVFSNNQQNITMQTNAGINVQINISRIDPVVNFDERQNLFVSPVSSLSPGTTYKIILGSGLMAKNGYTMGINQELHFSTASEITTTNVTVAADGSNKDLSITNNTPPNGVTITVPNGVTDATINVSSLLNPPVSGTVVTSALPAMTINANTSLSTTPIKVEIPAGITVSADASWNGTINLPTVSANNNVSVTPDSGKTATVDAVVEVGFGDVPLALSKPVRILLPGQAGKDVGYVRGTTFTKITNVLAADSGDSLSEGGDGYINVGSDLVIWTRHFTKFVAYTQSTATDDDSSGGSGGGSGGSDTQAPKWPSNASVDTSKQQGVITLSWPAATDNVGVTGYKIYKDSTSSTPLATVSASTRTYSYNEGSTSSGSDTFYVEARDAAGNWSTTIIGTLTTGQNSLNFNVSQSYLVTVKGSTATNIARISGNTSVPIKPTIMLNFDRGVTNDTVWNNNKSCITLRDSSGVSIPINVFWLTNQPGTDYVQDIFLTPVSNLSLGKTYTITISKNLKANNGQTLGESDGNSDQTVTFTVEESSSVTTGGGTTKTTTTPKTVPTSTATTVAVGGDNTTYNQAALATLSNPTSEQSQNAQLPADTPTVSSDATTPITLTTSDGVKLTVLPGTFNIQTAPVKMTVAIGTVTTPPVAEKTAVVLNPLKYERQFGVAGQADGSVQFSSPVTITFPIANADLPSDISTQQLAIYWWDSARNDWVKIGGVYDAASKTISVPTYHFSTYAVMADTSTAPNRLSGTDRFGTANAVADQGWKAGADNVVIANAYTFPDALAAGPLAFKLNAPILLTDAATITPSTLEEIKELAPKTITLIGGTAVISQAIQNSLSEIYGKSNVIRYGGVDRYETAAAIASALGTTGKAVIVNGEDGHYTDALAVSSYAAYNGIPILFTEASELPVATAQALTAQKVRNTIVSGGEVVVSPAIYNKLPGATRYGGSDRYETATAIATGLHLNLNRVYLVTGLDFPDALVAGNLAAHSLSPIVMVDTEMPTATSNFFIDNKSTISGLTSVGGEVVITPIQDSTLRSLLQSSDTGSETDDGSSSQAAELVAFDPAATLISDQDAKIQYRYDPLVDFI